jgi:predicted nucleic acid-binding protein
MTAVSNTSPLNYLLLIGEARVLPAIFGKLHVPSAVRDELLAPEAPEPVRQWASAPPEWVQLHTVKAEPPAPVALHRGETQAILLARELSADALLMDELGAGPRCRAGSSGRHPSAARRPSPRCL